MDHARRVGAAMKSGASNFVAAKFSEARLAGARVAGARIADTKIAGARFRVSGMRRIFTCVLLAAVVSYGLQWGLAQGSGLERTFPQSKATVEKALKAMQSSAGGRLPVLDGFATSADHPLDRYRRGYYQSRFQVSASPSGGSIVRVSVEVTAWYADPVAARSGYQLLTSNGRLEADLLDQLADQLVGGAQQEAPQQAPQEAPQQVPQETPQLAPQEAPPVRASSPAIAPGKPFPSQQSASPPSFSTEPSAQPSSPAASLSAPAAKTPDATEPTVAAPVPQLPASSGGSSSLAQGLAEQEKNLSQPGQKKPADEASAALRAEAESLEEVFKNQSHPRNLVAIKKSGTPVVETASLTAKTLFLASAHDEFEMLDFNRDWVHVRISGLNRGWIWRNSLEMPDGIPDIDVPTSAAPGPVAGDLFHVTREETGTFPGDWAPLRGKNVKIVSVEKINEAKDAGPQLRLEFAKSVLDKDYAELGQKPQELAGIVVIFDAVDGGMIAATFQSLQQWKAGKISDAALWHQCFFDPPETFNESGTSASQ
jgi:hypothetical protein